MAFFTQRGEEGGDLLESKKIEVCSASREVPCEKRHRRSYSDSEDHENEEYTKRRRMIPLYVVGVLEVRSAYAVLYLKIECFDLPLYWRDGCVL